LIGRIANVRHVPFNVAVPAQTAGSSFSWLGECAATPASQIEHLAALIVKAHDEKTVLYGASPAEVAQFRPAVVALAQAVADGLRADYLRRGPRP
jgi:hypothetical protein